MTNTLTRSPLWHPYTQHAVADDPITITRARAATLTTSDGRELFDAISSWWVNLHGHTHPRIANAIAGQSKTLEQVIFAGFTHDPAKRLADGLLGITREKLPGLEHLFLSDNGSTAVEAALKMAIGYWRNRGQARLKIAALEHAYHGDTFGAMSVSDRSAFTAPYDPLLFDAERLPFPSPGREQDTLDSLDRCLKRGDLAALIVEPLVLGAGGMLMYEPDTLRALYERCRDAGVLFIADEVAVGFGRTGTLFACEQAGFTPDILCLSKGITGGFMALGATLATSDVFDAFYSDDRNKTLFHGHSYSGSPLACAAANANLDIFREEPVMERIGNIASFHNKALSRFKGRREVSGVRQCGTIAAVELRVPDSGYLSSLGPRLYRSYISNNVLLRPLGNVVYLMPPYCSTEKELSHAYDAIEESLSLLAD